MKSTKVSAQFSIFPTNPIHFYYKHGLADVQVIQITVISVAQNE